MNLNVINDTKKINTGYVQEENTSDVSIYSR